MSFRFIYHVVLLPVLFFGCVGDEGALLANISAASGYLLSILASVSSSLLKCLSLYLIPFTSLVSLL